MQLIHQPTGRVVAEVGKGGLKVHDALLSHALQQLGIPVPPLFRDHFGGKRIIRADDPQFGEAFQLIYYEFSLDHNDYVWKD